MSPWPRHDPILPLPWRTFVAGGFLHLGLIAYLIVVPLACLVAGPRGVGAAAWLALVVRVSGVFLASLAVTGTIAFALAAAVDARDARHRRQQDDTEAARSGRRLTAALAAAHTSLGDEAEAVLAELVSALRDHDDSRNQALTRDLATVVRTATDARASAPAERRPAIEAQALASLRHLADAAATLQAERAAVDAGRARAAALYVERRYGVSDFATKPDGTGLI